MKKHGITELWTALGYSRLSKNDRNKGKGKVEVKDESDSIKNQRDLILDFVSHNPDIQLFDILAEMITLSLIQFNFSYNNLII